MPFSAARGMLNIIPMRYHVGAIWCVSMAWVIDLALVESWLLGLDQRSYEQVVAAVELVIEHGPGLGRPLVDTVQTSRHRNMKELRTGSSRTIWTN